MAGAAGSGLVPSAVAVVAGFRIGVGEAAGVHAVGGEVGGLGGGGGGGPSESSRSDGGGHGFFIFRSIFG